MEKPVGAVLRLEIATAVSATAGRAKGAQGGQLRQWIGMPRGAPWHPARGLGIVVNRQVGFEREGSGLSHMLGMALKP
jgi:hypothetical protein